MERTIQIKAFSISCHLGVPEEERATPQEISCDISFAADDQPEQLHDDLAKTIDYAAVSERFQKIVQERPRKLVETLVDETAEVLLKEFQLRWIEVTIRKFILPKTDSVSVTRRVIADRLLLQE